MTQYPISKELEDRISSLLAEHSGDDCLSLAQMTAVFSQAICELEQEMQILSNKVKTLSEATPSESDTDDMQPTNFINAHELPKMWAQGTDKSQSVLELVAEACGATPGRRQQIRLVITPSLHIFVGDTLIGNIAKYSITMHKYLQHGSIETIGVLVYSRDKKRWYVLLGDE